MRMVSVQLRKSRFLVSYWLIRRTRIRSSTVVKVVERVCCSEMPLRVIPILHIHFSFSFSW